MTELVAQRINEHITLEKPNAWCDSCIVKNLFLTAHAHSAQITAALGTTSDFVREMGECSICHEPRKVIRRA